MAGELSLVAVDDIAVGDEVLVDYSRGGTRPLPFAPVQPTIESRSIDVCDKISEDRPSEILSQTWLE